MIESPWQPVSKHNHVNEHTGRNQNAAVLRYGRRLFQNQRHYGIHRDSDDNRMHHHS
jgi:hypothetical protein